MPIPSLLCFGLMIDETSMCCFREQPLSTCSVVKVNLQSCVAATFDVLDCLLL